MTVAEKLKIVQQLTGLTQEQLAGRLSVSFPTINSWMNGRSTPRKANCQRIDDIYRKTTGQASPPQTTLSAKKQIISTKHAEHKNVLKFILSRTDVYDQFMLSLTYNTNRIEGSTLTEPETAAILFDGISLPNKTLVEQMEVKNHQAALGYLLQHLLQKGKLDEACILKMHGMLMNGIQQDAGRYRSHGVRIVGANVPTANCVKIRSLMKRLVGDINTAESDVVRHCAHVHSRFEQIHPFSDGNGRIGRLLIHAMLLRENYPPAVILQEKKRFYLKFLNNAQVKQEFEALEEFLCDAVLSGFGIIEKSI